MREHKKVGVLRFGQLGNVGKISNVLSLCGFTPFVFSPDKFATFSHEIHGLVIPGVGDANAIPSRQLHNLKSDLLEFAVDKKILGICIGMQILAKESEEDTRSLKSCLGFINAKVSRLTNQTLPRFGTLTVKPNKPGFFKKQNLGGDYYFMHSFGVDACDHVTAECQQGVPAVIEWGNFLGVQFHPECSGESGKRLIKAWFEND